MVSSNNTFFIITNFLQLYGFKYSYIILIIFMHVFLVFFKEKHIYVYILDKTIQIGVI